MTQEPDITAGRCGQPAAGRWCVLRAGHAPGQRGTGHRATPRTPVEQAAAQAFAARNGTAKAACSAPPRDGLCAGPDLDPDLFFAAPGTADEQRAKAVCRRCPNRDGCLRWALGQPGLEGVWGGAGEADRAAILAGAA